MNAARRKKLADAIAKLGEAKALIEEARDEEQEYLDAMPESFQQGAKGEKAEGAIESLDSIIGDIEEAEVGLEDVKAA